MIWELKTFKKMVKEAYKGSGLVVAKRGEEYIMARKRVWRMVFHESIFQKEYKAAVIEVLGDLPEAGEILLAVKGEPVQHELEVECWLTDERPAKTFKGIIVPIAVHGYQIVEGPQHMYTVDPMLLSAGGNEVKEAGEIPVSDFNIDEETRTGYFWTNLSEYSFKLHRGQKAVDKEIIRNLEAIDWEVEDDEV